MQRRNSSGGNNSPACLLAPVAMSDSEADPTDNDEVTVMLKSICFWDSECPLPGVPSDSEAAALSDGGGDCTVMGAELKASSKFTIAFLHDPAMLLVTQHLVTELLNPERSEYRAQCTLTSDSWQSACVVHSMRHPLVRTQTCLHVLVKSQKARDKSEVIRVPAALCNDSSVISTCCFLLSIVHSKFLLFTRDPDCGAPLLPSHDHASIHGPAPRFHSA